MIMYIVIIIFLHPCGGGMAATMGTNYLAIYTGMGNKTLPSSTLR